MFESISRGVDLARCSWRVLMLDKEMVVFPILSGLSCMLLVGSFIVPVLIEPTYYQNTMEQIRSEDPTATIIGIVALFLFYFLNYTIVIFFNSALVACALIRFRGGDPTVADGLQAATNRMPQIVSWALVAASVGLILQVIESKSQKFGRLISGLVGAAWSIATFFIVPVLVVEKLGPYQAFQRSISLFRKTWGETMVGSLGLGMIGFLLSLPGMFLIVFGVLGIANKTDVEPFIPIAVIGLGVVGVLMATIISAALKGICIAALYEYAATGEIPDGFDRKLVSNVFGPRGY